MSRLNAGGCASRLLWLLTIEMRDGEPIAVESKSGVLEPFSPSTCSGALRQAAIIAAHHALSSVLAVRDGISDELLRSIVGLLEAAKESRLDECPSAFTREEINFLLWCVGFAEGRARERQHDHNEFILSNCEAARNKLMSIRAAEEGGAKPPNRGIGPN